MSRVSVRTGATWTSADLSNQTYWTRHNLAGATADTLTEADDDGNDTACHSVRRYPVANLVAGLPAVYTLEVLDLERTWICFSDGAGVQAFLCADGSEGKMTNAFVKRKTPTADGYRFDVQITSVGSQYFDVFTSCGNGSLTATNGAFYAGDGVSRAGCRLISIEQSKRPRSAYTRSRASGATPRRRVVVEGCSLPFGAFGHAIADDFTRYYGADAVNCSVSSSYINRPGDPQSGGVHLNIAHESRVALVVAALSGQQDPTLVLWPATNDLAYNAPAMSVAYIFGSLVDYCAAIRAAVPSVKIYAYNEISRYGVAINPDFHANRLAYNALLSSDWDTCLDGPPIDIGSTDSPLGAEDANTNQAYFYSDRVHLINHGHYYVSHVGAVALGWT